MLVKIEGHRWAIEDSFETAKNDLGLDYSETRSWHGWHRYVSLVIPDSLKKTTSASGSLIIRARHWRVSASEFVIVGRGEGVSIGMNGRAREIGLEGRGVLCMKKHVIMRDAQSVRHEIAQGTAAINAAKRAGVEHFVWSTLPNVRKISGGKYDVRHFTDKAVVDAAVAA